MEISNSPRLKIDRRACRYRQLAVNIFASASRGKAKAARQQS